VYTPAWGPFAHRAGTRTVVVKAGVVKAVLKGGAGAKRRAGSGERLLTARAGSTYDAALAGLRIGDKVQVTLSPAGELWNGGAVGKPSGLLGISSVIVNKGRNKAGCGYRDEILRPRTAIGWKANGDMVVAAVSGRDIEWGIRFGGATVHQWAEYLRKLGVVHAAIFDGGNSTTLLVRKKIGGPLVRLDRLGNDLYQRPVTDALAFVAD
jgi:hypothetical protein